MGRGEKEEGKEREEGENIFLTFQIHDLQL